MGLIAGNIPLTNPDPATESRRRETVPGMAHWAGTGPENTTCRQCLHWNRGLKPDYYRGGFQASMLKPAPCDKYRRMMNDAPGPAIEHYIPSCRHFEPNEKPPKAYHEGGS